MSIVDTAQFKEFEGFLMENINLRSNGLIKTLPGLGVSYFINNFIQAHRDLDARRITSIDEDLGNVNILDMDFNKNRYALKDADHIFRLSRDEKLVFLVVNTPNDLHSEDFRTSYTSERVFNTYTFKVFDNDSARTFAWEILPNLQEEQFLKAYAYSGGIARLIKYFMVSTDRLGNSVDELLVNQTLTHLIDPIAEIVTDTPESTLREIGIKTDEGYKGEILKAFLKLRPHETGNAITIETDLTFFENGHRSDETLIKLEKDVLEHLMKEGVITREKIAEIKWGENSYDDFSDQAINKSIQRLNKKLKYHQLTAIPKVGYKLEAIDTSI
ncbi:helix-turn-helix domain-containing protein [Candidatus Woesebacteria bacterium]|nr:MAG: helix-turn-helix domain-containing protein [Candidatus Woesebacteria bacterium]